MNFLSKNKFLWLSISKEQKKMLLAGVAKGDFERTSLPHEKTASPHTPSSGRITNGVMVPQVEG